MHLQAVHLQELQLLIAEGRVCQAARPHFSDLPHTSAVPVEDIRVKELGEVLMMMPSVLQRLS